MITKMLWGIIILSVIAVIFMGTSVLLLIVGIIALSLGLLSVFSKKFDTIMELKVRPQFETNLDRKIFSKELGHFLSRYVSGVGLIGVGAIMVLAYFFIFK